MSATLTTFNIESNKYLHTVSLEDEGLQPPTPTPWCFTDDFIDDKIKRAEVAVVEVSAQFELFLFFLIGTHK